MRDISGMLRSSLAVSVAGVLTAGALGVVTAGPASADPVSMTLKYRCLLPLVGEQDIVVKVKGDVPKVVSTTASFKPEFEAVATLNAAFWSALERVGAKTANGTGKLAAKLEAPSGTVTLGVPVTVGDAPPQVFKPMIALRKPGPGRIVLGDMTLDITPRDTAGNEVKIDDPAADVHAIACTVQPGQSIVFAEFQVGYGFGIPPTTPGRPSGTTTSESATLTWGASTDADGDLAGYDVLGADGKVLVSTDAATTTATITGLSPDTGYTFTVRARDKAGNFSAASEAVNVTTQPSPLGNHAPSAPANGTITASADSVILSWDAATDIDGDLAGYEVYDAATGKVVAVTDAKTTTTTITGVEPGRDYVFTVRAKDARGNRSDPLTISMTSGTVKYGYTLKGSTFVKAPNGTAVLDGTVEAKLKPLTGEFTADLAFQPTRGDFKIFGFLPVQAGIVLVPEGETTGTLKIGTLTAHSRVTAKLPAFSLFGISIGGGENCRTAAPSDITLTSEPGGFEPLKGGRIKGTYDLSEIKDCGALTPLLSAFTKGAGNTVDAVLTLGK
ncbi:fibronectin type III domain-containing protein [Actinomadura macrotermitis]|uniref:Fibronectin type-III domain-containing protein n=1 Tax=Actinomadura macrotermitis TaxID=2585200 RepID=A0A7K0BV65_9ACTN|nr:fibronectin type III domain-containing protein [Actinomadura macrotermitis]MQY04782.1 hypothetical protein [Actinomadura macrotermitis]